jgi:hypothetical protein|tara:strand:- start:50 stop:382 length:333 start_codon:yes stop_codon:yes gene_type:complete
MGQCKELDHHLKEIINRIPDKIMEFAESGKPKMTYYTGSWQTDILNNYTEKQSEKIFKKMQKLQKDPRIMFFQKRNKPIKIGTWSEYGEKPEQIIESYDYLVVRSGNAKQ